jgi:hypothetical protein
MLENLQKTLQNIVSFKCLKNQKINLSPAILKLEILLYQNTYILFHLILYSQSGFDSKKSGLREKKHAIFLHGPFNSELIVLSTWINHIRQSCVTTLKKKRYLFT